ncbi:hypothetical protein WR25_21020 [Diploscapter pachys]|uniref:Uncharacterized protein n=1 Tax=Diploscapter pachys TaxID=2018661 RepID=A0A2A2KGC6_9BILA|nr:hypothetical protein WR25_21020 [Diploscapter pachys]
MAKNASSLGVGIMPSITRLARESVMSSCHRAICAGMPRTNSIARTSARIASISKSLTAPLLPVEARSADRSSLAWMPPCPLGKYKDKQRDRNAQYDGGDRAAERKPTLGDRLVKKITDRRPQWPGQDEGRPEQDHAGNMGAQIERGDYNQRSTEHERSPGIAEAAVGDPVAERGAEGLRQGDGDPVEGFRARSDDGIDRDAAQRPIPGEEGGKHTAQQ